MMLASFVGLGGMPYVLISREKEYREMKIVKAATVGLFETIPGFFLQTSLFCLTFANVDDTTRSKQLISLALCEVTICTILFGLAKAMCNIAIMQYKFVGFLGCSYITLAGSLSIYCPLRIWFAYTCPDHLWNLTTGCWGPHGDAHGHHHLHHHHHHH